MSRAGIDYDAISRGFSAKAGEYDELAQSNAVVAWIRSRIRDLLEHEVQPPGSILEINAGSGIDAAYFASRGYRVHATDVAAGMIAATAEKAREPRVGGRLTYETLSFTDVAKAAGAPYDLVFSNLGGLNCTNDLRQVVRGLPMVLKPGGVVVWVVMPPLSPWELGQALRGHIRTALRRLRPGGTTANVEGAQVKVWYHWVGSVRSALGPSYEVEAVRSYCLFAPPSFFAGFIARHPHLTRLLMAADDVLGRRWPFNRCGDFVAVVARHRPRLT